MIFSYPRFAVRSRIMWHLIHRTQFLFERVTTDMTLAEWTIVGLALVAVGSMCLRGHASANL